ncbi:hypothetical protein HELRODRAFT_192304 [Helobdella robusta]|uniref:PDZ domain-containing protein n=1 Tax=Helobdella robusta TaxID=6412 RepID=T1FTT3_HELRO|nr:hypothetical protein HELRODRAFT_192304 [Helobdella robusta]ESO01354.1 hypothetical protein HELRODRAFT_192304 [Helobdella robusta]
MFHCIPFIKSCNRHVEYLDKRHCNLQSVPDEVLRHTRTLEELLLDSNQLSELPRNLTYLCLNDISLNRLPCDIGSLVNLENLELRENFIKYLPSSMSLLKKLRILDLGNNLIEELPNVLGSLLNLEELLLDCNELSEIPPDIGKLKKLTQLDISENKIEVLPDGIGGLVNIIDLYLSRNLLEYLPDTIDSLGRLCILKVDQNQLVKLTPHIGMCHSLQELILTENLLADLPGELGQLQRLTNLNLDRNRLSSVPGELGQCGSLGVLSLRDNRLVDIPEAIGNLKNLHVLDVAGNRLHHLPLSLGSCNLKAIWLSENQTHPMLHFQEDEDAENVGKRILTCFLLPQLAYQSENSERDGWSIEQQQQHQQLLLQQQQQLSSSILLQQQQHQQQQQNHVTSIAFVGVDDYNSDAEQDEIPFKRQNTPHPKELRTRHVNKLTKKEHYQAMENVHDQIKDSIDSESHKLSSKKSSQDDDDDDVGDIHGDDDETAKLMSSSADRKSVISSPPLSYYSPASDKNVKPPPTTITFLPAVKFLVQPSSSKLSSPRSTSSSSPTAQQLQSPPLATTTTSTNIATSSSSPSSSSLSRKTKDLNIDSKGNPSAKNSKRDADNDDNDGHHDDDDDDEEDADDDLKRLSSSSSSPVILRKNKPRFSGVGNDEDDDNNDDDNERQSNAERHVGFASSVDEFRAKEGKLRRRDTPHHLKNKRIVTNKMNPEEKLCQILAQSSLDSHKYSVSSSEDISCRLAYDRMSDFHNDKDNDDKVKKQIKFCSSSNEDNEDADDDDGDEHGDDNDDGARDNTHSKMRRHLHIYDSDIRNEGGGDADNGSFHHSTTASPKMTSSKVTSPEMASPATSTTTSKANKTVHETITTTTTATTSANNNNKSGIGDNKDDDVDDGGVEMVFRISKEDGVGLGMNVAGGLGSSPFRGNDKVNERNVINVPHAYAVNLLKEAREQVVVVIYRENDVKNNSTSVPTIANNNHHMTTTSFIVTDSLGVAERRSSSSGCGGGDGCGGVADVSTEAVVATLYRKEPHSCLGFKLTDNHDKKGVYISDIVEGGVAILDGRLKIHDRIMSINGCDVSGKSLPDVVEIVSKFNNKLTIVAYRHKLIPVSSTSSLTASSTSTLASTTIATTAQTSSTLAPTETTTTSRLFQTTFAVPVATTASATTVSTAATPTAAISSSLSTNSSISATSQPQKLAEIDDAIAKFTSRRPTQTTSTSSSITSTTTTPSSPTSQMMSTTKTSTAKPLTSSTATSSLSVPTSPTSKTSPPASSSSSLSSACFLANLNLSLSYYSRCTLVASPTFSNSSGNNISTTAPYNISNNINKFEYQLSSKTHNAINNVISDVNVSHINNIINNINNNINNNITVPIFLCLCPYKLLLSTSIVIEEDLSRGYFSMGSRGDTSDSCGYNSHVYRDDADCNNDKVDDEWMIKSGEVKKDDDNNDGDDGIDGIKAFDGNNIAPYPIEVVHLNKGLGPLGLSIVGGRDQTNHPFGEFCGDGNSDDEDFGVFISRVSAGGVASNSSLKIGDRILSVNNVNLMNVTHAEAVKHLSSAVGVVKLVVRKDPQPLNLQEVTLVKEEHDEKLGISIRGGHRSKSGNPANPKDEGIFISKIHNPGLAYRDGRLKVGQRILEVNHQSILGLTHQESVSALKSPHSDSLTLVVCSGFDPDLLSTTNLSSSNSSSADLLVKPDITATTATDVAATTFSCSDVFLYCDDLTLNKINLQQQSQRHQLQQQQQQQQSKSSSSFDRNEEDDPANEFMSFTAKKLFFEKEIQNSKPTFHQKLSISNKISPEDMKSPECKVFITPPPPPKKTTTSYSAAANEASSAAAAAAASTTKSSSTSFSQRSPQSRPIH